MGAALLADHPPKIVLSNQIWNLVIAFLFVEKPDEGVPPSGRPKTTSELTLFRPSRRRHPKTASR